MAGKARVHELAKELGVTSKEILARLAADGERIKSASSTIEAPVARRLRASYDVGGSNAADSKAGKEKPAAANGTPQPAISHQTREHLPLTADVILDVCAQYRLAQTSDNPISALDALFEESREKYGVKPSRLRSIIANEQRRRPAEDGFERSLRSPGGKDRRAERQQRLQQPDPVVTAQPTMNASDSGIVQTLPQRRRIAGLPPVTTTKNLDAIVDIVASRTTSHNREAIITLLQEIAPPDALEYGYLTWRYGSTLGTAPVDATLSAAQQDLVTLGIVVDYEKGLLDSLVRHHGSILTQPALAKGAMDDAFREFIGTNDTGRSAAAELRRTRAAFDFLRRAIVLTVATGDDQHLWDVLGSVQPLTERALVVSSPQLERAIRRLSSFITSVERLLSTDEANFATFTRRSRAHLVSLQLRRYDFLRRFRAIDREWTAAPRPPSTNLTFQVLPQGEELRAFLGEIRRSKQYSGHRVDEHRLTVLEDLEKHFGAGRCVWHKGAGSSDGIGNRYLVLAIKTPLGSGDNAVAISPLAGQHATYVVRRECAEADWKTLFAQPKFEARLMGARKLLFTPSAEQADPYRAMFAKIVNLLHCHPSEFRAPLADRRKSRLYRSR